MLPSKTTRYFTKKALLILVPLILINAGVLGTLFTQISIRASANNRQVLDVNISAPEEGNVSTDSTPEDVYATDNKDFITIYKVVPGDTISQIAQKFGISTNTIRWANDMDTASKIKIGQELKILPVTGMQYTVKKGDTISGIAIKFKSTQSDILEFNNIDSADKIKPGVELIIPEGEPIAPPKAVKASPKNAAAPKDSTIAPKTTIKTAVEKAVTTDTEPVVTKVVEETEQPSSKPKSTSSGNYFINPIPGSQLTQGLHDGKAVDMGAPTGTEVIAAASGKVITAKDKNTWNGGYGYYVVIEHDNGTKTLYAHLSRIDVEVGDDIDQGERVGLSGRTGRVTGPHLHFEVIGATNPFTKDKIGTRY